MVEDCKEKMLIEAEKRVSILLRKIEDIDKLSDKNKYEYTAEQIDEMFLTIETALENAKGSFNRAYLCREDIQIINGEYDLSFMPNTDMGSLRSKIKLMGQKNVAIGQKMIAVFYEKEVIVYAPGKIIMNRNANRMFYQTLFKKINLSGIDTSNVTSMYAMFEECAATEIEFGDFDTRKVTNMNCMFSYCEVKDLNLSKFNTSKVTDMTSMFDGCRARNIDVSSFNTEKTFHMRKMFAHCINLEKLNLIHFNFCNVAGMFYDCKACRDGTLIINDGFIKALAEVVVF